MAQAFRTQNLRLLGNLYDKDNSLGAKGYSLFSTGNGTAWQADQNDVSGIMAGGVLSIGTGNNKINISAGYGQVYERALVSGEVVTTLTNVSWNAFSDLSLTHLATSPYSYIYIDKNGSVQQSSTTFTDSIFKNNIVIGIVVHLNNTTIDTVINSQNAGYGDSHRLYELFSTFGPIKRSGLEISANGANLKVNRASGSALLIGCNYTSDQFEPDTKTISAYSDVKFARIRQNGSGGFTFDNNSGSLYTVIDPNNYDDGDGTLASVTSTYWTVQRLYLFPSQTDRVLVYYGVAQYASLNDAINAIPTESFIESSFSARDSVFLGYLIVKQGATALNDSNSAKFLQSGLSRSLSLASSGSSGGGGNVSSLDDLSDVEIDTPTDAQFLTYVNSTGLWQNNSLTATAPISFTGVGTSLNISLNDSGVTSGKLAANSVITAKILNNNVTLEKLAQVTGPTVLGKLSGGAGNVAELTGANIATIIDTNTVQNSAFTSNLLGGIAGVIPYQSGADTTSFTSAGTAGQILLSDAGNAPKWSAGIKLTNNGLDISDANGNELIKFPSAVTNAVNEITISNAATTTSPSISATGGDTDVNLRLLSKGAGKVLINDKIISLANSFITSGNFSLTLTTTGATNVTLPTTGTLAATSDIKDATLTIAATAPISLSADPIFTANASANKTITISVDAATSSAAGVVSTSSQSFAGNKTFTGGVTIEGSLTVNGTTTTINSNTLSVDDKNIELGSVVATTGLSTTSPLVANSGTVNVASTNGLIIGQTITQTGGTGSFGASPVISQINSETQFTVTPVHTVSGTATFNVGGASDDTANGGGITLKSVANKTLNWVKTTTAWTSSENFDLASGKVYKINAATVLSDTTLGSTVINSSLTSVGTLASLTVSGLTDTNTLKISNAPALGTGATLFFVSDSGDVKTRTAAQVRADIGAGTGNGTVTSVTGTAPINVATGTTTPAISLNDAGVTVGKLADDAVETAKIKNSNVTYAKIQNVATSRVLGRIASGAGVVEELTGANIATIIDANTVQNSGYASNLSGGIAGSIPYQSDVSTTLFVAGNSGQVLLSGGSSAPTWANQNTLSVNLSANVTITTDDSTNSSYYLYFGSASSGSAGLKASTKIRYNPNTGAFSATTKSFRIPHPTKSNHDLVYGSLESPYHGIRLTGKSFVDKNNCVIILPDYIFKLIDENTVNIQLTSIGCSKALYVKEIKISENKFVVAYDKKWYEKNKNIEFFWDFTAERKDVSKLIVEEKL